MVSRAILRRAVWAALVAAAALTLGACGGDESASASEDSVGACSDASFLTETACMEAGHQWDLPDTAPDGVAVAFNCDCGGGCSNAKYETMEACEGAGSVWGGGVVCGMTLCGETCGVCNDAATSLCWDGACTDPAGCDVVGFTDPIACANDTYCTPGNQPYAQAATTPSVAGGFKVKYAATVDDYSLELDPVLDADALADGRPIAKKKIFLTIDHNAYAAAGGTLLGLHQLGGDEAKDDCTFCVRAGTYCNDKGCGQDYVATEGTLKITSSGEPGSQLTAVFEDVKFTQVYLHQVKDDGSYKVAGQSAKVWCLGDFPISYDIPEPTQPVSDCVTEGSGVLLGDNIADYTLQNCYGDEITLHSRCGRTKAVWVVAVAGW